jgi:hypothetical protein
MSEPKAEFLVVDHLGQRIAGPVYVEEATHVMRLLPSARAVVRESTRELIAAKKTLIPREPWEN